MLVFANIKLLLPRIYQRLKITGVFLSVNKLVTGLSQQLILDINKIKEDRSTIFSWDVCPNSTRLRILLVVLGFSLCFLSLAYRLLTVANNEYVKARNYPLKSREFRREIVDRNGHLLAVSLPTCSLFANPQKVIDPKAAIKKLVKVVPNINNDKLLLAKLTSDKTFIWVKRDILPQEQEKLFNLGLPPGFDFEHEQKRLYIFGNLLSHVIGYVSRDCMGLAGIEKQFDQLLTSDLQTSSERSAPLALSIDVRLQSILSEEIDKTMEEFRAIGAVGIIASPNTGEILAMVSKPDFNPHQPQKASAEQLFSRPSLAVFEIGSVFKTLPMAIGLDTNDITIYDAYDVTAMQIGKFSIKDYHAHRGWQTIPEIFLHSSNIGMGQIVLEIGKDNLKKYFKDLKLLDRLEIELPECGMPLFPADNSWTDLSIVTMSYGYGLAITPLHFVQAVLPIVNGGNFYPLTLIKKPPNSKITATKVFKEQTSMAMNKLLRLVVREGTGKRAEVKGYLVGGKTGTAEKLVGNRYAKNSRISSFLGVLPASDPKYVIYIMLDEPKGNKASCGFATAGFTAAPVVGRVIKRMAALYGLAAVNEHSTEVQNLLNIDFKIDNEV